MILGKSVYTTKGGKRERWLDICMKPEVHQALLMCALTKSEPGSFRLCFTSSIADSASVQTLKRLINLTGVERQRGGT